MSTAEDIVYRRILRVGVGIGAYDIVQAERGWLTEEEVRAAIAVLETTGRIVLIGDDTWSGYVVNSNAARAAMGLAPLDALR